MISVIQRTLQILVENHNVKTMILKLIESVGQRPKHIGRANYRYLLLFNSLLSLVGKIYFETSTNLSQDRTFSLVFWTQFLQITRLLQL